MADINLSAGNDLYTQSEADKNLWNNYFGKEGNDVFKLFQGTVIGGPGNDTLERMPTTDWWRGVQAAYWDSPKGVKVDLEAGTADDGWGGTDTLIGIGSASGSGNNDWFKGNADDNQFWPGNGNDTVIGGGGIDRVTLPWFEATPGQPWRAAHLEDVDISVSVDGRSATIGLKGGKKGFVYTLTDVEKVELETGAFQSNEYQSFWLADFIKPQDMAQQAIAAGGELRWNASQPLGTAVTLSYSFVLKAPGSGPGQAGFRAFTPAEQQAVREILARTAAITGLNFTETSESGGGVGQLRFGASAQSATKGVSWLPNQAGAGDQAGDVWMDVDSLRDLTPGGEGYAALLHEIGHALGLRHPRNTDPGESWPVQLREVDDRSALSVMSQAKSSDGLFRSDWGMLDVLALRWLYGTRAAGTGNDSYKLGLRESAGQTTLVDDGGIDTLDASALTSGVSLDLNAGRLSSVGVTSAGFNGVENLGLPISSVLENAIGSPFDDVLLGNGLDNLLTGGLGNDWIEGGAGTDTAVFAGKRTDYELSNGFGKVFVEGRNGSAGFDTLIGVERLQFADQLLVLADKALGADANLSVDEDQKLAASLPDPSDMARSSVSYSLAGAAGHGTATLTPQGTLSYTPAADFWGVDSIAYEITGGGASNRYVAYVNVRPINDYSPVGRDGEVLVQTGALFQGVLPKGSDADGDVLSYSLAADAKVGAVAVNANGEFAYQAKSLQLGSDSFSYSVSDGLGGSATYTVKVNVAAVFKLVEGTAGADALTGVASGDGYSLRAGNDRVTAAGGDDIVDGGAGLDTAIYSGARANFKLTATPSHWTVEDKTGAEGVDSLVAMERIQFKDLQLALDLDGNAGVVAQVIRGIFGAGFLKTKEYVGIGLQLVDGGMPIDELVNLAMSIPLVDQLAGSRSNRDIVQLLYKNVAGKLPTAAELDGLTGLLDSGAFTQNSLALLAVQHPWNTGSADLVGLASTGLEFVAPAG